MTDPRFGDGAASVERRDEAQRRLWPITSTALAGGLLLTVSVAGVAWLSAPGRAASAATVTSPSSDGTAQYGDDGFQAPAQAPGFGGFGRGSHAVSGGS